MKNIAKLFDVKKASVLNILCDFKLLIKSTKCVMIIN